MNEQWTKEHFTMLTENYRKQNKRIEKIVELNKHIKKFNWAYIHPYLLGAEINFFEETLKTKELTEKYVYEMFAAKFFNLHGTAYFIDAYCKTRPQIKPFCQLIDQSVIMCIQRDYAGAINTLLPVIEGSIRHYLVNKKGKQNAKIMKTDDLISAFDYIKEDFLSFQERAWDGDFDTYSTISFDTNQKKELLKLNRKYIDMWLSIIKDYFKNNLYLDTRNGEVSDKLNRHAILHGFNSDIYYDLKNYLRVFNCLHFLCWVFAHAEKDIHVLPILDEKETYYKWQAFEKIKVLSDISVKLKSQIYEKYSDFDKTQFEEGLIQPNGFDKFLSKISSNGLEKKFKAIDDYVERTRKARQ